MIRDEDPRILQDIPGEDCHHPIPGGDRPIADERANGNQTQAADMLGVNRNTLRKKVRDLDLQVMRAAR